MDTGIQDTETEKEKKVFDKFTNVWMIHEHKQINERLEPISKPNKKQNIRRETSLFLQSELIELVCKENTHQLAEQSWHPRKPWFFINSSYICKNLALKSFLFKNFPMDTFGTFLENRPISMTKNVYYQIFNFKKQCSYCISD